MTQRTPWWYSGDESTDQAGPSSSQSSESAADSSPESSGTDWMSLLGGAQRLVDWAAERVMAPHAGHANPAEHPDCLVCKSMLLVGERFLGPFGGERREMPPRHRPPEIVWIPVRDE